MRSFDKRPGLHHTPTKELKLSKELKLFWAEMFC